MFLEKNHWNRLVQPVRWIFTVCVFLIDWSVFTLIRCLYDKAFAVVYTHRMSMWDLGDVSWKSLSDRCQCVADSVKTGYRDYWNQLKEYHETSLAESVLEPLAISYSNLLVTITRAYWNSSVQPVRRMFTFCWFWLIDRFYAHTLIKR